MSDAEIIKHLIDSCNECYEGPDTPDPSLDYANELIARYEAVKTDYKCLQESMYEEI